MYLDRLIQIKLNLKDMKNQKFFTPSIKFVLVVSLFVAVLSSCASFKRGFKDGWNAKKEVKKLVANYLFNLLIVTYSIPQLLLPLF